MLRRVNGRHKEFPMSQTSRPPKGIGTATFTLAGIAAAFGLAACCALPFLLASVGLGAAWLAGVAVVAAPYRTPLLTIGALCLIAGAVLLTRSEEHTSELQSLMRLSYAVFCLKKKKTYERSQQRVLRTYRCQQYS